MDTLLRQKNIAAILNILQREHCISRASIAQITGLTPATVSKIVLKLEKSNIVHVVGPGKSSGGRRPMMVEFNPHAFYLSGIDIGVKKAISLIIDLHGNIISREKIEISPNQGRDVIVQKIFKMTHDMFSSIKSFKSRIKGIGLSFPGLINREKGIPLNTPKLPEWHQFPLVKAFESEFKLFTCIENDAKALTLGESRFGAGKGIKNVFVFILGDGIGSGIIINGELYRGNHYTAGEFGHITVNPTGPTCTCGNKGCLQVMAGGIAIATYAIRIINSGGDSIIKDLIGGKIENISAKIVAEAARQGDKVALQVMHDTATYIGIGLANVVNLISPEMIILGGGVSRAGDFFIEDIINTVKERAYTYDLSTPKFVLSTLGENGSSIGAAALVLDNILNSNQKSKMIP